MKKFYSDFLKKQSFLNSKSKSYFYSNLDYLKSQGFKCTMDLHNKIVLELGAGAGRLTKNLYNMGIIKKTKKYYIVEPSDGIEEIKLFFKTKNCNQIEFIKDKLENLDKYIEKESIDYFICYGVLPHINLSLDDIFDKFNYFIKKKGKLHVVFSYYGFQKKIADKIRKKIYSKNIIIRQTISLLNLLLQITLFNLKILRGWYIENFIYSPHFGIVDKYLTFIEYYSVNPYNIQYNYKDIINAAVKNGFDIDEMGDYSLSIVFLKKGLRTIENNIINIEDRKLYCVYLKQKDYFYRLVINKIQQKYPDIELIEIEYNELNKVKKDNKTIVFCWNYYDNSYFIYKNKMDSNKENKILFFQMLI
ncbi:methyltransferase domain-containing protein [Hippea jasoniae]|uniref:methyltransferase domain-containing protein n=1 Tax=Hippea jasoniae TaxID=944479 RepID=UPI0005574DFC|nr:class I SAM-dependent methyltransferase [Hippea jasoniae]